MSIQKKKNFGLKISIFLSPYRFHRTTSSTLKKLNFQFYFPTFHSTFLGRKDVVLDRYTGKIPNIVRLFAGEKSTMSNYTSQKPNYTQLYQLKTPMEMANIPENFLFVIMRKKPPNSIGRPCDRCIEFLQIMTKITGQVYLIYFKHNPCRFQQGPRKVCIVHS